jgi:hypothetical protein
MWRTETDENRNDPHGGRAVLATMQQQSCTARHWSVRFAWRLQGMVVWVLVMVDSLLFLRWNDDGQWKTHTAESVLWAVCSP